MTRTEQKRIPMLDLTGEIEELWPSLSEAVLRVLKSGNFVLGPEVAAFEREVADYLGVKHAIGLNSGTDALVIGLRALGIEPGDEVITTAFSFFATAEAIVNLGATPVFIDVCEASFNIDPDLIEAAITGRTKAIIPVHLFGRPAAIEEIVAIARTHGLKVLEDCAQSFGASAAGRMTGTFGDAGAFSFYPTKNLGAYGDGGMLVTNDDEVAELARMLRNHGASPDRRYENRLAGYNSRLDEIQAAVLRVKLQHVERWNAQRRAAAERYRECLAPVSRIRMPDDVAGHVYHQFTVRVTSGVREEVVERLRDHEVATSIFYPKPLHHLLEVEARLPIIEELAGEVLSLPIWPGMDTEDIDGVSKILTTEFA